MGGAEVSRCPGSRAGRFARPAHRSAGCCVTQASSDLPDQARIVVIGGGVGGASIAYHLAERGENDVLVLERSELTSGSTFHSAGLVGQLRGSVVLTRMMMDSAALYRRLASDPDTDPGWIECGGIRLACSPERMEELERQVGWAESFGLPLQRITADEAQALFPPMSTDRVLGATYLPTDGYLDPSRLTYVLAAGARRAGGGGAGGGPAGRGGGGCRGVGWGR